MHFNPDIYIQNKNRKRGVTMADNRYYGQFGGQYVSESLMNTLKELEIAFNDAMNDPEFIKEYMYYLKEYVGRENPLYYAEKLSKKYGAKIYLKREDLNHTGAHKINNVIGQILLAKRMGKTKVIAETGAGQHGVATATGAALFGMECTVYMGAEDIERQALNVFKMELLGAKVQPVTTGSSTLKDATNEAIRTWAERAEDTFYVIGSAVGPHPYPKMVKEFQRIISTEARRQILEKEGRLPDAVVACVGGGSNSIGMFADFMDDMKECVKIAKDAGIADDRIILDPGVGFGKTYEMNLEIIDKLEIMKELGYPVLLGTSRKSVIGLTLDLPVEEREEGTMVTTVYGVQKGCAFVRVHDVEKNKRAIRMTRALMREHEV